MSDLTPEGRYPAEQEDVDTIIEGKDGRDYVIDVVEGKKKWVLYVRHPSDLIIEKVISLAMVDKPKANNYQAFVKEMTLKLKEEEPNLAAGERLKKIQQLWRDQKA